MKFLISLLLTALLSLALGIFFPWWSIALAALTVALTIYQLPGYAFVSGFAAVFLLWGAMAWWINSANQDIMASRISLIVLKQDNPLLLVLITALIGGLVAGMASLTGSLLRRSLTTRE